MSSTHALPLVSLARSSWSASKGRGVLEIAPRYTRARFRRISSSPFGRAPQVASSRSFEVPLDQSPDVVLVHTSGRQPSTSTVRTIRATVHVLTDVYGHYPHDLPLEIFLNDSPVTKVFPDKRTTAVRVEHINSGFSVGNRIVVTRCSEMQRTIVHECVHVWRAHGRDSARAQKRAHTMLKSPPNCLLTEAFVEAVTWLIHGGFCPKGLRAQTALQTARKYLTSVRDDGRTNGWAYFVGKAMLLSDGGRRFHAAFFPGPGIGGRRLVGEGDHTKLVDLMLESCSGLGGPLLQSVKVARGSRAPVSVRMCTCSPGPPFDPVNSI